MYNWWIGVLEKLEILTHEQAVHLADKLKNSIHKENYTEALQELESILDVEQFKGTPLVTKLESDIDDLKSKVLSLESRPEVKDVSEDLQKLEKKVENVSGTINTYVANSHAKSSSDPTVTS